MRGATPPRRIPELRHPAPGETPLSVEEVRVAVALRIACLVDGDERDMAPMVRRFVPVGSWECVWSSVGGRVRAAHPFEGLGVVA